MLGIGLGVSIHGKQVVPVAPIMDHSNHRDLFLGFEQYAKRQAILPPIDPITNRHQVPFPPSLDVRDDSRISLSPCPLFDQSDPEVP
jgi:hypothetical protein